MARKATERRTRAERDEHERRVAAAESQPHRRGAKGDDALDVRLESPIGRLHFRGLISKAEYEAGRRYALLSLQYLQSIGAPYPHVEAIDPNGDVITVTGQGVFLSDEECERRKRNYDGAYEALFSSGQRPAVAVKNAAVYERDPRTPYDFELLRIGLRALAEYFGGSPDASNVIPFSRFRPV